MKYQFVSINSLDDINYSSGMPYFMAQTFKQECKDIFFTDNLQAYANPFLKLRGKFQNKFFSSKFSIQREPSLAEGFARQLKAAISMARPDFLISTSSIPVALLDCSTPIMFWTDATFAGMVGFYESFSNLCNKSLHNGNMLEKEALHRCKFAVYSSQWAADTASTYYDVPQSKLHVVPFGANIENPIPYQELKNIILNRSTSQCNLLFIGKDWKRKRGDFAVEITDLLNEMGQPARLYVVGTGGESKNDYVEFVGHLDKSRKEDAEKFQKLMSECHYLILPTTADTTPNVVPEANAFGMPAICTNVGGISSVIEDDVNGKLFDLESTPAEYAQYIYRSFADSNAYSDLAFSSFGQYENRLNWKTSVSKVKELISDYA